MFTKKRKRIIRQILPFALIPGMFSVVQTILEKGILGDHPVYPSTGNPYSSTVLIPLLTSLFIGFSIGLFEVLYVNKWFQNRRFYEKILFKFFLYVLAIIFATLIIIITRHSIGQGLNPFDSIVLDYVYSFFSNFAFWSILCYYSLAIGVSLFYKEVSDNIGQGASLNFLTGKYHQPKVENRVFMFLDMKSSTAHAEKLGHIKYFQMLKDYYADISLPILDFDGEIYQYVGDEIVITWEPKTNKEAADVINCFYGMKNTLLNQHSKYDESYGITPTFKAAIHYGQVTTGEIGLVKKDFVFTGDTLNTTARIQGLCNNYGVDLIVSQNFIDILDGIGSFNFTTLGNVALRGRSEKIEIYKAEENKSQIA
ncbi:adenylate/guanylate cyclase domain-containing protein [Roseivirga misakiensis]|uniref:adenylate/guanylate cyclase domain-containing protein n=1 Tax=Roseivirga misakiensis TaxID=1563681 RepID=UPI00114CE311|nr:adenylate/guanylate cyclase domain-containing protein [Roseivirga misakiensis]